MNRTPKKGVRLVSMPVTHAEAVRRVLRLVDGYLSNDEQDTLRAFDGGVMTYGELRQHIKAALNLVPTRRKS